VLIPEVELMAREKEAEEANGGPAPAPSQDDNGLTEWMQSQQGSERPSTLVREIPVLPNKR
jgi:hypothetical protein